MRGGAVPMTCGGEMLESNARNNSQDWRLNDPRCVGVSPVLNSEIGESTSSDDSVPVKLLFETPNIRLFEIGIDEVYGYANYGWTETSEGSWGAGGDAGNHQPGSKSLWVTLTKRQSVSLRTANGWLIVGIDGLETEICPAHEIEYLHIHGGDHTIDMTAIEKETLSANLLIDLKDGSENGTFIGRSDADCLIVGDGIDQFFLGQANGAGFASVEFVDDLTENVPDSNAVVGVEFGVENEILNSLFCDVAFIDSAKLGGGAVNDCDEDMVLVTDDVSIAFDETLPDPRCSKPSRPRVRLAMEMNL